MSGPGARDVVEATRRRLRDAGVPDRHVVLPGEDVVGVEGAVHVVDTGGWRVVSRDEGVETELARTSDLPEACEYVLERLTGPLPPPLRHDVDLAAEQQRWARQLEPVVAGLRAQPGATAALTLPTGSLLDRWGALDGLVVHPAGQPLAQRSLPPSALVEGHPWWGLQLLGATAEVTVLARLTPPRFGQPGGGVAFRLEPAGTTVRDLVGRGALRLLDPGPPPAGG